MTTPPLASPRPASWRSLRWLLAPALGAALLAGAAAGCDDASNGGPGGFLLGGAAGAASGAAGAGQPGGSFGAGSGGGAGKGGSGGSPGQGGGAGQGGKGGGAGKGGSGAWSSQSELCAAYIECTAETNPAGLGVILEAYGATGNCWSQGNAALCDGACSAGLATAHKAFPDREVCNRCASSKDCPSSLPACDAASGRCVACLADGDCHGKSPACDPVKRACVACTEDFHCPSPGPRACDAVTQTCVPCTTNAHCAGSGSPVCDTASHTCRSCQADDECASGVCNQGQCAQCKTDAQCGGAAPHCGPYGLCVGCGSDADCPGGGVCNTLTSTCCGDTGVCKATGTECGTTIDLQHIQCLLTPVECGACAGDLLCVQSKCVAPPATKCDACAGACAYVPESKSYECVSTSSSCDADASPPKPCSKGYECRRTKSQLSGEWYSYCARYCLEDADCGAGHCEPIYGVPGLGTCQ